MWPHPPPIRLSRFLSPPPSSPQDQFGCPFTRDPLSPRAGTGGPPPGSTFVNLATGESIRRNADGTIPDEHTARISNAPGTLSMANTGRKDSGGSQFFINVGQNAFLDWFSPGRSQHPVFGKVVQGYDLIVRISKARASARRRAPPNVLARTAKSEDADPADAH